MRVDRHVPACYRADSSAGGTPNAVQQYPQPGGGLRELGFTIKEHRLATDDHVRQPGAVTLPGDAGQYRLER